MAGWPPADAALLRRLTRVDAGCWRRRAQIAAACSGSPTPPTVHQFGTATAIVAPETTGYLYFNMVYGLETGGADLVEAVLSPFAGSAARPTVEVVAGLTEPAICRALAERGFAPGRTGAILVRLLDEVPPEPPLDLVAIGPDGANIFAEALLAGFEMTAEGFRDMYSSTAKWIGVDGWRHYAVRLDGRAAAAATLAVEDGIGYLAMASTLPEYRRRGCQTALVARRLRDAAELGCELASVFTGYGSASHRNQERAGFRLAGTLQLWAQTG